MDWGMAKLHPVVLLLYSLVWLVGLFCYAQSWWGLLFFAVNLLWFVWRLGKQGLPLLKWYLLLSGITFLFHLVFYHRGRRILGYLFGQPVTVESVVYGLQMAVFLCSLLLFWQILGKIFAKEKWIYLWRPILPQTTMVFLFSGGLFARCKTRMLEKWQVLWRADDAPEDNRVSFVSRCRKIGDCFYAFSAWSIQWALETVDSVQSRGYGISPGSSRVAYRFCGRDYFALIYSLLLWLVGVYGRQIGRNSGQLCFWLGFILFLLFWEGKEGRIWRHF